MLAAGGGGGAYYGVNGGFGTQQAQAITTTVHHRHAPKPPPKPTSPPTVTVSVYFTLRDPASRANGCTGTNGFDDIGPGGTLTLTDESGKVIGSGTFGKAYTSASTV